MCRTLLIYRQYAHHPLLTRGKNPRNIIALAEGSEAIVYSATKTSGDFDDMKSKRMSRWFHLPPRSFIIFILTIFSTKNDECSKNSTPVSSAVSCMNSPFKIFIFLVAYPKHTYAHTHTHGGNYVYLQASGLGKRSGSTQPH